MIEFDQARVDVDTPAGRRTILEADLRLDEPRVSVIGANGSGKSTLLKLINGLVAPTSGSVRVAGHDTVAESRRVIAIVGHIFTEPLAQLVMSTPLDDVELSLRRMTRDRAKRRQRARELLEARGLADLAERSVYDLSGGERQLVSLTSVLAVEPKVIVADEPTTLLDLRNRRLLQAALQELGQQLVLATHDLALAGEADRTLLVDEGRVVADGAPGEVIERYRRLMET